MAQHDVEVPVPLVVAEVEDRRVLRHADDVDDGVETAERPDRVLEHARRVVPAGRVAVPRDATDLLGHSRRALGLDVDAADPGPDGRERVRGLATDPLAGADHEHPATVEPQQIGIGRDRRRVGGLAHGRRLGPADEDREADQ